MANYWLTFRIEEDTEEASADWRRYALYDTIEDACSDWWLEPTSFILFSSEETINALTTKIRGVIDPKTDLVLLHKVGIMSARAIGDLGKGGSPKKFMNYVTIL